MNGCQTSAAEGSVYLSEWRNILDPVLFVSRRREKKVIPPLPLFEE
jgi:hypothetical protein